MIRNKKLILGYTGESISEGKVDSDEFSKNGILLLSDGKEVSNYETLKENIGNVYAYTRIIVPCFREEMDKLIRKMLQEKSHYEENKLVERIVHFEKLIAKYKRSFNNQKMAVLLLSRYFTRKKEENINRLNEYVKKKFNVDDALRDGDWVIRPSQLQEILSQLKFPRRHVNPSNSKLSRKDLGDYVTGTEVVRFIFDIVSDDEEEVYEKVGEYFNRLINRGPNRSKNVKKNRGYMDKLDRTEAVRERMRSLSPIMTHGISDYKAAISKVVYATRKKVEKKKDMFNFQMLEDINEEELERKILEKKRGEFLSIVNNLPDLRRDFMTEVENIQSLIIKNDEVILKIFEELFGNIEELRSMEIKSNLDKSVDSVENSTEIMGKHLFLQNLPKNIKYYINEMQRRENMKMYLENLYQSILLKKRDEDGVIQDFEDRMIELGGYDRYKKIFNLEEPTDTPPVPYDVMFPSQIHGILERRKKGEEEQEDLTKSQHKMFDETRRRVQKSMEEAGLKFGIIGVKKKEKVDDAREEEEEPEKVEIEEKVKSTASVAELPKESIDRLKSIMEKYTSEIFDHNGKNLETVIHDLKERCDGRIDILTLISFIQIQNDIILKQVETLKRDDEVKKRQKTEIKKTSDKNFKLVENLEKMVTNLSTVTTEKTNLEDQLERKNEEVKELRIENEDLRKMISGDGLPSHRLQEENESLRMKIKNLEDELENEKEKMSISSERSENFILGLRLQMNNKDKEIKEFKDAIEQVQDELRHTRVELEECKTDFESYRIPMEKLKKDLESEIEYHQAIIQKQEEEYKKQIEEKDSGYQTLFQSYTGKNEMIINKEKKINDLHKNQNQLKEDHLQKLKTLQIALSEEKERNERMNESKEIKLKEVSEEHLEKLSEVKDKHEGKLKQLKSGYEKKIEEVEESVRKIREISDVTKEEERRNRERILELEKQKRKLENEHAINVKVERQHHDMQLDDLKKEHVRERKRAKKEFEKEMKNVLEENSKKVMRLERQIEEERKSKDSEIQRLYMIENELEVEREEHQRMMYEEQEKKRFLERRIGILEKQKEEIRSEKEERELDMKQKLCDMENKKREVEKRMGQKLKSKVYLYERERVMMIKKMKELNEMKDRDEHLLSLQFEERKKQLQEEERRKRKLLENEVSKNQEENLIAMDFQRKRMEEEMKRLKREFERNQILKNREYNKNMRKLEAEKEEGMEEFNLKLDENERRLISEQTKIKNELETMEVRYDELITRHRHLEETSAMYLEGMKKERMMRENADNDILQKEKEIMMLKEKLRMKPSQQRVIREFRRQLRAQMVAVREEAEHAMKNARGTRKDAYERVEREYRQHINILQTKTNTLRNTLSKTYEKLYRSRGLGPTDFRLRTFERDEEEKLREINRQEYLKKMERLRRLEKERKEVSKKYEIEKRECLRKEREKYEEVYKAKLDEMKRKVVKQMEDKDAREVAIRMELEAKEEELRTAKMRWEEEKKRKKKDMEEEWGFQVFKAENAVADDLPKLRDGMIPSSSGDVVAKRRIKNFAMAERVEKLREVRRRMNEKLRERKRLEEELENRRRRNMAKMMYSASLKKHITVDKFVYGDLVAFRRVEIDDDDYDEKQSREERRQLRAQMIAVREEAENAMKKEPSEPQKEAYQRVEREYRQHIDLLQTSKKRMMKKKKQRLGRIHVWKVVAPVEKRLYLPLECVNVVMKVKRDARVVRGKIIMLRKIIVAEEDPLKLGEMRNYYLCYIDNVEVLE